MRAVRCQICPKAPAHAVQDGPGIVVDQGCPRPAVAHGDLDEFVRTVGGETQFSIEPAGQAGVDCKELIDLLLVSRADETEIEAVHFQRDE